MPARLGPSSLLTQTHSTLLLDLFNAHFSLKRYWQTVPKIPVGREEENYLKIICTIGFTTGMTFAISIAD